MMKAEVKKIVTVAATDTPSTELELDDGMVTIRQGHLTTPTPHWVSLSLSELEELIETAKEVAEE